MGGGDLVCVDGVWRTEGYCSAACTAPPEAQSPKASPPRRDILRRVGSMTGSFHKPKEEAAGEPRESLAKRRARAKTMENLASGR